jgi:hypothetical protein
VAVSLVLGALPRPSPLFDTKPPSGPPQPVIGACLSVQLYPPTVFRLKLTHQLLAAHRVRSMRGPGLTGPMLRRPFALQASLVQTLLVTSNVIVALRFEVRRKPVHLSNSLITRYSGRTKRCDSDENSQSRNPRALFHLVSHLSSSTLPAMAGASSLIRQRSVDGPSKPIFFLTHEHGLTVAVDDAGSPTRNRRVSGFKQE